jgi:hypothetical protein
MFTFSSSAILHVENELAHQAGAAAPLGQQSPRQQNCCTSCWSGPGGWNEASQLATLCLPADPNLTVTFHSSTPMEFTHQGTDFTGEKKPSGIAWPAAGTALVNGWASWSWDVDLKSLPGRAGQCIYP